MKTNLREKSTIGEMMQTFEVVAKPFLKWAGGKGQLIDQISGLLPKSVTLSGKIDKYFEPFVGGGAIFFWLSQEFDIKSSYLYDINPEIIIAYQTLQAVPVKVIEHLKELETDYLKRPKESRSAFYYDKRTEYNNLISKNVANHKVLRTALMIFLNKTCFNGLFRVNSKGLFNVPTGQYRNPTICDTDNLLAVSRALKNSDIRCCDFKECLKRADDKSFVYLDPPYRPISRTSNFTSYIRGGFGDSEQRRLKEVFEKLDGVGASLMLSNSDPKNIDSNDNFFDDLYKKYTIRRLDAMRMINCNSSKRGLITEVLITNY